MARDYAQIILPVPLFSSFTYSVPEEMEKYITIGSRVLVQFGRKKIYTGLVESFSNEKPGNFEIKPIMALLDEVPIIHYPQLKLWDWISQYYLCSKGDVYKAAVPTGLKPESETFLSLNPEYVLPETEHFTEKEALVIQYLEGVKKVKLEELQDKLKLTRNASVISRMIDKGILEVAETVSSRYRPKTKVYVRLKATPKNQEEIHSILDSIKRAKQQEKALIAYLDLSKWLTNKEGPIEVEKDVLLEKSKVSPAVLTAMRDKGIFDFYKAQINRFDLTPAVQVPLATLSEAQTKCLNDISDQWRDKGVVLFRGVTGSGKTEIYTHLMDRCLKRGAQVLYLVPEISLTTQLTDRLKSIFGNNLLVYHSRFSDNERVDIWKKMMSTRDPLIVIGARSSVFLPFFHLGLVIVDEEHESSFKQYDPAPRYNARDTAIVLAKMHGAKTLLGSATPSIESYYKALHGKYGLVELTERYDGSEMPEVEIVDMKKERKQNNNKSILSTPLLNAAKETIEKGKQIILFQNRRGFAPVVVCKSCGWTPKCCNCDVSLVYHKHSDSLHCHYCGYAVTQPHICPACQEPSVEVFGYGTERIEEEIKKEFEDARISRMDLDSTRNKDSYQNIINEFANKDTDILVGTQMVTKGLDFNDVEVVGVLNADTVMNFPDFRSNERAFNMIEQVAGRAGRRKSLGKVFIQTTSPESPVLNYVKRHDYLEYYYAEIKEREELNYPPFSKIIMVYIKNKDDKIVEEASILLANALRNIFGERILGPEKPFVSRVATFYLRQIMIKVENGVSMPKVKNILRSVYESLVRDYRMKSSVLYYDVDPM